MSDYITINCLDMFMGQEALKPGMKLKLIKESNNPYDDEAIKVVDSKNIQYGYVANSVNTVLRGTHSAGYYIKQLPSIINCTVMFISDNFAIAKVNEEKITIHQN